MKESVSLTETTEFSAEKLLYVLCPTFNQEIFYKSDYRRSLLEYVIENIINTLDLSKKISGIEDNQQAIEIWLLNVLREIYKSNPKTFTKAQIKKLKLLAISTKERMSVQVIEYNHEYSCYNVITDFQSHDITQISWRPGIAGGFGPNASGGLSYTQVSSYLENHNKYLSLIVAVYDTAKTNTPPVDAARLLMEKICNSQEQARLELSHIQEEILLERTQKIRENFSRLREKYNLPEAELRESNHKRHRVTHCYNCNNHLETGVYLECSKCNWLVCECGACGCGYTSGMSANGDAEYDACSSKNDYEGGEENGLLSIELSEDRRLYAKSKNDGWFYDDTDKENKTSRIDY